MTSVTEFPTYWIISGDGVESTLLSSGVVDPAAAKFLEDGRSAADSMSRQRGAADRSNPRKASNLFAHVRFGDSRKGARLQRARQSALTIILIACAFGPNKTRFEPRPCQECRQAYQDTEKLAAHADVIE